MAETYRGRARTPGGKVARAIVAAVLAGLVLWVLPGPRRAGDEGDGDPAVPSRAGSATSAPARPSQTSATSTPPPQAEGRAAQAVLALPVRGRAPRAGYDRAQFGPAWVDVDRNGCDTRNDMLRAALASPVTSGDCRVLSGTLRDPYSGQVIRFVRGGTAPVSIDHVVALSDAWQKGAQHWPYAKRVALANDPVNLQPTASAVNEQKGDADAASWVPANPSYRCTYVARQVAVKLKYDLWMTPAERQAILRVLGSCPGQALPPPGPQPTIASNTGGPPPASDAPGSDHAAPAPLQSPGRLDPRFDTCGAARMAGYGPYVRGRDPEYDWYRDRDDDAVVCE